MTDPTVGTYVRMRDDLRDWHYGPERWNREDRHPEFSDSDAWTHCICFGAAWQAVEPLLALIRQIADAPARRVLMDHSTGEWVVGLRIKPEVYREVQALTPKKAGT